MKLEISLSATPILYHITNTRAAAGIVQKNRFELKPSDGTEAEEALQGKAAYYLSTARHKTASFTVRSLGVNSVIFVLNGNALATKYKIKSVDFWSGMYTDREEIHNRDRMEAEDRVLSNSPFIDHVERYIKEIHIYRGTEGVELKGSKPERLIALQKFGLKNKIPVFFYNDVKPMLTLNKAKAVPLNRDSLPVSEPEYSPKITENHFKYRRNKNELSGWLQLYNMPAQGTFAQRATIVDKSEAAKMSYKHLGYNYNGDPLRQLNAGMHNEKSTAYGAISRGREDLDELIKILRQNKWTPKQFIQYLYDKWYPKETEG